MLAWLGGSKRRRWHTNQSKKKGVNKNSNNNDGGHWAGGEIAAGATGAHGNQPSVELSNVRWANAHALHPTTTSYGHNQNRILPNTLAIPSLDMFALAGPSSAAEFSRSFLRQPSREPPAGTGPPRPWASSHEPSAVAASMAQGAGAPAKWRREDAPGATPKGAGDPAGTARPCSARGRIYGTSARGTFVDNDDSDDEAAADLSDYAEDVRVNDSYRSNDPAVPRVGCESGAAVVNGRSGGGGSAGDPDGASAGALTAAAAAGAGPSGSQPRRRPAVQHSLSGAGGQTAADRAPQTRCGAAPATSLDILWMG